MPVKWYDPLGTFYDPYDAFWFQVNNPVEVLDGFINTQGNPFKRGKPVRGGDFWLFKKHFKITCTDAVMVRWGNNARYYQGQFVPQGNSVYVSSMLNSDQVKNPEAYADEAWNRTRPAKPIFNAALNLLELKDIPGQLEDATLGVLRAISKKFRNSRRFRYRGTELNRTAEWHLAVQFGWLPILGAIQDFHKAQDKEQKALAQVLRDAGRPVKREAVLFHDSTSDEVYQGPGATNMYPVLTTGSYADYGECWDRVEVEEKVWAEGQFVYFLPPGPQTVEYKKALLRRLYGWRPTPSVIYNLMPWSFLLDYFTNLGEIAKVASAGVEDRLYANYFYVMSERVSHSRRQCWAWLNTEGGAEKVETTVHEYGISKRRVQGHQFGLKLKQSELSASQVGILGALGLSRLGFR